MVAGSQAQLELQKVSLHVVEIGKGLGIMKRCGQTLKTCVLLSQVGERWVGGGHMESVIPTAAASMPLLQLAPTGDPSPQLQHWASNTRRGTFSAHLSGVSPSGQRNSWFCPGWEPYTAPNQGVPELCSPPGL